MNDDRKRMLLWIFAWFWFLLIVGGVTALGAYSAAR
jgi:hypothetical protein